MLRLLLLLLLVEDNPADRDLFKEAVKEYAAPVQLCTASDGIEALAFLYQEVPYQTALHPDLIVLDLNLPRISGQTVLARVKKDAALQQIPVVVVTSSSKPEDITQSYTLGANAYLRKPLQLVDYFAMVHGLLEFWGKRAILPSAAEASYMLRP
jgi:two-component system, chemotaxis family, response regulator Rcp1